MVKSIAILPPQRLIEFRAQIWFNLEEWPNKVNLWKPAREASYSGRYARAHWHSPALRPCNLLIDTEKSYNYTYIRKFRTAQLQKPWLRWVCPPSSFGLLVRGAVTRPSVRRWCSLSCSSVLCLVKFHLNLEIRAWLITVYVMPKKQRCSLLRSFHNAPGFVQQLQSNVETVFI